jgi:hypothetical protein
VAAANEDVEGESRVLKRENGGDRVTSHVKAARAITIDDTLLVFSVCVPIACLAGEFRHG